MERLKRIENGEENYDEKGEPIEGMKNGVLRLWERRVEVEKAAKESVGGVVLR